MYQPFPVDCDAALQQVRQKTYEELLVIKLSPEDQAMVDETNKANCTPYKDFGHQNAREDHDDRASIAATAGFVKPLNLTISGASK
ncbi:hypothetical protein LTR36_010146 [Oleoguttula mirabilis]|uniref:Uncharacterized protein n=1 Tax=Oleoguttula mirabilis TaxID=1507867 RepID=A0AAV9JS99_9PEZI|nr:hypothetical protein LTR36_010146 [Oleoguttula mirabilis]